MKDLGGDELQKLKKQQTSKKIEDSHEHQRMQQLQRELENLKQEQKEL